MAKLRTRNHKVVLARSAGGDAGITVLLVILGVFMFLPMLYVIMQSLKPLDELWMYPPRFIVTSPTSLMFNATVTTITSFILMSELHWLDTYWALIVPAWGSTLGLYLMKQFMDTNVNDSVLESARLDGAREFRIFWTIAMPMVKPAWLTLIIYSFQGLWNAGASMYIYSEQYKSFNYAIGIKRAGASAASQVIMMLVPITVFVISQSNIIETMGSSGMKD